MIAADAAPVRWGPSHASGLETRAGLAFLNGWTDLGAELDPQRDDHLVTQHARSAITGTGSAGDYASPT
ncbi:hypothetical protein AB0C34_30440 [Nocardia sp. NPDC049220]|uniref:hypothetical protein n=1 Tax=Nocardia sp. NPDC049220 TaxID=3155273 RepID=UPI0033CDEB68